jgi:hypothetical protein
MSATEYKQLSCEFTPMLEAISLDECQELARTEIAGKLTAFVVRARVWPGIITEAGSNDPGLTMFQDALGGAVIKHMSTHEFDGPQPTVAHVDEVFEELLDLKYDGRFDVHQIVSGAINVSTLYTEPGYYTQGSESRIPRASWNYGITQDIQRRKLINPVSSSNQINEARLEAGDRVVWFERASRTVDGFPNTIHLFDRGTVDRYSRVIQYYANTNHG